MPQRFINQTTLWVQLSFFFVFFSWVSSGLCKTDEAFSLKEMAPEVEELLQFKSKELQQHILESAPIFITLKQQNFNLSQAEILQRDEEWRQGNNPTFTKNMLNFDCSLELRKIRINTGVFAEIFITSKIGVNECLTNPTSDYYQADEDWWQTAFHGEKGAAHFSEIEFDQSSQTFSIAVFFPIYQPGTNSLLGVVKAVIDLTRLRKLL